jgi:AraC family transcriptional regulator of adaptative response / DNA-3-methyladenine glycosylase II
VQRVRWLFDTCADPAAVDTVLGADPVLAPLVAGRPGMRVPGALDGFELAVRAILGQQVSVAAATTAAGRLARRFGRPLPEPRGSLSHAFPEPAVLAAAPVGAFALPRGRGRALQALARAVADGALELDAGADRDQALRGLLALPGVGPWTAGYIAMRALRDPDALPAGDLGLRRALAGTVPRELETRTERWRPWRAYGVLHLWTAEAVPMAEVA